VVFGDYKAEISLSNHILFYVIILAEYIKQCKANDPMLVNCIKDSIHHLRPWLRTGIPEIQVSC
jgi:hypothetical protein